MSKYFIVTTHGRTASHWLSANLNKHPDIICNHGCFGGTVEPIINFSQQCVDDRNIEAIRLQAEPAWKTMTIETRFERLRFCGEAKVYGTVHGDNWHRLGFKIKEEKPAIKIKALNVVRHPIPRIVSQVKEWLKEEMQSPSTAKLLDGLFTGYRRFVTEIEKKFNIDFANTNNRRFVVAIVQILERDARDLCLPGWHIPMERLTLDTECFFWFLRYVTDEAVDIPAGFMDEVMTSGKTNYSSGDRVLSRDIFEEWEEWKKELFTAALKRLSFFNLSENYQALNYDLSFCLKSNYDIQPVFPDLFLPLESRPEHWRRSEYDSIGKCKLLWEEDKRNEIADLRKESGKRVRHAALRGYMRGFIKFAYPVNEKIALYGAGSHTEFFLQELKEAGISPLPVVIAKEFDQSRFGEVEIIDAELFDFSTVDKVIISSRTFEGEIFDELLGKGVDEKKIIPMYDITG